MSVTSRLYSLEYGGEVSRGGNCLFESLAVAMGSFETASEVQLLLAWTEDGIKRQTGVARHQYQDTELVFLRLCRGRKTAKDECMPTGAGQVCVSGNAAAEQLVAT